MPCANTTLEQVLQQYGDMVLRVAFSCLKNREEAEDILQDVMVKLLEKSPTFENAEHQKAWLLRVTINLCRNRLRSPWRKRIALEEHLLQQNSWSQEGSELLTAVWALPEKYREVIHLFYYEDYSIAQISGILHKKETTVRSLLHRARGLLREQLKEVYLFEE